MNAFYSCLKTTASTLFVACQILTLPSAYSYGNQSREFDLLIRGGRVVDGTGAPWYSADVGIQAGVIAKIGRIEPGSAADVIDATGLIVAPGFIDMMGQTATPMMEDPSKALNLLTQGITTINAGEGSSAAPLGKEAARQYGWRSMGEYFQLLDLKGLPVNVVQTIGHTQVRRIVMGEEDRRPRESELEQMQELVREAMQSGAIGLSTALIYPPAVYARTEEIASLAEVAGQHGGRYYTHMRNEGNQLLEAIDEAIAIGTRGNTPVHIFHLKAAGRQNWGKMPLALARIHAARSQGIEVTADVYPYTFNGLGLEALIHPRHFARGRSQLIRRLHDQALRAEIRAEMESKSDWENWYQHVGRDWDKIVIGKSTNPKYNELRGQTLAAISEQLKEDPWDTFFNLVEADAFALTESMSEANKILAMQHEFISFCTDVGPMSTSRSTSHPRSHGSFPRLLSHYVRDLGTVSLEQAVSQASSLAANEIMAFDRGRISVGQAADIIVFDQAVVQDNATAARPHELSQGMRHVIVNGVPVLLAGKQTARRPGRVLRGPGYDQNLAPHRISTGEIVDRYRTIDDMLSKYLAVHRAPGMAIAISENGEVTYARGFGYADVASAEPVQPTSLFRIASISKPITAVAVLQLVDSGKLDLDTPVFSILGGYEPHLEETATYDERQKDITIRHLLQHRGGWDRDVSFDAMFQSVRFAKALQTPPPAGCAEVIRCMLGQPLDFDPGQRYAYSNYGYCLLGRVIEELTGQSYESYVKDYVLRPLDIDAMAIGATLPNGRKANEVRYYDPHVGYSVFAGDLNQRTPQPYGAWHLEAMDAHGAWIASAIDLVKFASAFDDAANSPLLGENLVHEMFARPEGLAGYNENGTKKNRYYALGWQIDCDDTGEIQYTMHGGSLPGTSTKLVKRADGKNFAILFNARETSQTSRLAESILKDLHAALDKIE